MIKEKEQKSVKNAEEREYNKILSEDVRRNMVTAKDSNNSNVEVIHSSGLYGKEFPSW